MALLPLFAAHLLDSILQWSYYTMHALIDCLALLWIRCISSKSVIMSCGAFGPHDKSGIADKLQY